LPQRNVYFVEKLGLSVTGRSISMIDSRSNSHPGAAVPRKGARKPRLLRRPLPQVEELEARDVPSAVFASSFFDSAVYQFDSTTGALQKTLIAPNSGGLLSTPEGLTVGPDRNLYISSQLSNAILQYNLTTNTLTTFLPSSVLQPLATPTGNANFAPAGLRFGPDGDLYVDLYGGQTSTGGGEVIRFGITSSNGTLSYSGTNAVVASGLLQPTGLTFGTAVGDTDTLYATSLGGASSVGMVSKITHATSSPTTTTFIQPGTGGLNFASNLIWGPDGKLYVVDLGATSTTGNVLRYNADGSFDTVFTHTNGSGQGSLTNQFPSDAVFDSQGNLITANLGPTYPPTTSGSIYQYTSSGVFSQTLVSSSQFPSTGSGTSGISPSELALAPSPSVTITSPAANPSTTAVIPVTVTFNTAVTGFTASEVVVGNGSVSNFTGSGTTYTFSVIASAPGAVTVSVPANVAQDSLGDNNAPSATFTRTFAPPGASLPPLPSTLNPGTVTVFDPSSATWYLRYSNNPGAPSVTPFAYGGAGWIPVVGDWNGDGTATIGVVDPSTMTWYLKNSNSSGTPDYTPFRFGATGWVPVVGDWDGSGHTEIGAFDPSTATFYLRREVGPGAPDAGTIHYGGTGWVPVVGDWDGNGTTTIGVVNPTTETWYLRNSNTPGTPDITPFAYGAAGWLPVAGDWNGDGITTIGAVNSATETWYLRNTNGPGAPDISAFAYGASGWLPLAGAVTPGLQALRGLGGATPPSASVVPLTQSAAQTFVGSALARLQQDGVSPQLTAQLGSVSVTVGTLGGNVLAQADPQTGRVILDADAAGYGWFVDSTPLQDTEFAGGQAIAGSAAAGRMDLLTAMLQELGAAAGLKGSALTAALAPSTRNVAALDAFFAQGG
jgi:hypothetical protein